MIKAHVRSVVIFLTLLSAATIARADVLPSPDPTDPLTLLTIVVLVLGATAIGYFVYRRRGK